MPDVVKVGAVSLPPATGRRLSVPRLFIRASKMLALAAACLLAAAPVTAMAGPRPPAQNQLDTIIDGLQRKYSRMAGMSANFVQIFSGRDGRNSRESGSLLLKRPGKARWEYTSPEKKLFISDGKSVYFYVAGEGHATKISIKESADPQIPFLFLLGRGNLRRDFSRIELLSDERAVNPGNVVLRLAPTRAPEGFKRLLVEVNPSTFEVSRMVIIDSGRSRMDFVLSNVRENAAIPDSQFQFIPPQGVTVRQQ